MAGVKSVERVSISIPNPGLSASASLTKSQTIANCVPFVTKRATERAQFRHDWNEYTTDVYFSGSSVYAATNDDTRREMEVEVTVVEFDPDDVNVYQGTFTVPTSGSSDTQSIGGTVVVANSFVLNPWKGGKLTNGDSDVRGRITSTTQVTFDRASAATNGDLPGHFYVVESKSGADFTVQAADLTLSGTSADATLTAVDMDKTFLVGSYYTSSTSQANDRVGYLQLFSTTVARAIRADATGSNQFAVQAVEFDSGGAEDVQRGTTNQSTADASEDIDITAADLDLAMAWTPAHSSCRNASFPGSSNADLPDAQVALTFVDTDTIRLQHWTGGGEADNDIAWEVVEWELNAAATTRRVMIIS